MGVPKIEVGFRFLTGVRRAALRDVRLTGNWDQDGHPSEHWSEHPMAPTRGDDGCPAFVATVGFDPGMVGRRFTWGVRVTTTAGEELWGIPTEVPDPESQERHRSFVLERARGSGMQIEAYHLTQCRRLGAQKVLAGPGEPPGIRFSLWAPHAWKVEVVFGQAAPGYVADDGSGQDRALGPFELERGPDGVWNTSARRYRALEDFSRFEGRPYLFRITLRSGREVYRVDPCSRSQVGEGGLDPRGRPFEGPARALLPRVSCSLVRDLDHVAGLSRGQCSPRFGRFPAGEFWQEELRGQRPVLAEPADLVLYQLQVEALGGEPGGTLSACLELLDHLQELGVNAIELLAPAPFEGFAPTATDPGLPFLPGRRAGDFHLLKHFVREAHRRDMLVLRELVLDHLLPRQPRGHWQLDSEVPEENAYYWYQGHSDEYPHHEGGYVTNGGPGWTPDWRREMVRGTFQAAVVELLEEYQLDGFRIRSPERLVRSHRRVQDGTPVPEADAAGARFLRELGNLLALLAPGTLLLAGGGSEVTVPELGAGAPGFRAWWQEDFHQQLMGAVGPGGERAQLLEHLAWHDEGPAPLTTFARALEGTHPRGLVTHLADRHAGSRRDAPVGPARATARSSRLLAADRGDSPRDLLRVRRLTRLATGLAFSTPSAPFFLMGEEVGAQESYDFGEERWSRADLIGLRHGEGAALFRWFQELACLRRGSRALRRGELEILLADDAARLLVFRRSAGPEELLVVVHAGAHPFPRGYRIHDLPLPDRDWNELLASDATRFGGDGLVNEDFSLPSRGGTLELVLAPHSISFLR